MDHLVDHLSPRRALRFAGVVLVVVGVVVLVHEALSLSWPGTCAGAGLWGLGVLVAWHGGWMEEAPDDRPPVHPDGTDALTRVKEHARELQESVQVDGADALARLKERARAMQTR